MTIAGKRILLTGGRGFLGRALAERLADENEVLLFDVGGRPAPGLDALRGRAGVEAIDGDVLDPAALAHAMRGVDVVVHLAAVAGVRNYHERPIHTLRVNFVGTLNVLDAACVARVQRVVSFSSSEVYGAHAAGAREAAATSLGPVSERRWSYAAGKIAADHLAHAFHAERGLAVTTLRPFNVYGPGQVGEGAVHAFAVRALLGLDLEVTGRGETTRAWCHVDDLVEATARVLERDAAVGHCFNVGNPEELVSTRALAERIRELAGSRSPIVEVPHVGADVVERSPDIALARALLGWEPRVSLADGLARTVAGYRALGAEALRDAARWLEHGAPHGAVGGAPS